VPNKRAKKVNEVIYRKSSNTRLQDPLVLYKSYR